MNIVIAMFLVGMVAGFNHMAIIDPLNYRSRLFNKGIGGVIFDVLALLSVIASIYCVSTFYKHNSILPFMLIFIFFGGIGYGVGGLLMKGRFGGVLPVIANIIIIAIAVVPLTKKQEEAPRPAPAVEAPRPVMLIPEGYILEKPGGR